MRKRPVIVARPWETSLKLSRTSHWSALRSTWTARWGPADDLPSWLGRVCTENQCETAHTPGSRDGPNPTTGIAGCCARAAEQRDERASLQLHGHSITSSARSRNDSGIVSP